MLESKKIDLSLNLMPSFYHKHIGIEYGEGYYFDPVYRSDIEKKEQFFIYDILGKFGEGSKKPAPSANLTIQPVDLIMATQGAKIVCPVDATLETWGAPWKTLTVEEIDKIDPVAAANHPVIDNILKQYHEIVKMYGEKADILGIKAGSMNIHTPYTTAHQLCGEELFYKMIEAPEVVKIILLKVWQIYKSIYQRLTKELKTSIPTMLIMGDCSASLLSAKLYQEIVLPINVDITKNFKRTKYHSCGSSTHLLKDFVNIPKLFRIELGPGTDLGSAVQLFPDISIAPLFDPISMLNSPPNEIENSIINIIETTTFAPETLICAWSLDRETPLENLDALCATVNKYKNGIQQ